MCDHAKWAAALGLRRIIHKIEANEQQGTECAPQRPCMSDFVSSQLQCLQRNCLALAVFRGKRCCCCRAFTGLVQFGLFWLLLSSN